MVSLPGTYMEEDVAKNAVLLGRTVMGPEMWPVTCCQRMGQLRSHCEKRGCAQAFRGGA